MQAAEARVRFVILNIHNLPKRLVANVAAIPSGEKVFIRLNDH